MAVVPFGVIKMKVFDQILWRINGLLILERLFLLEYWGLRHLRNIQR